MKLSFLDCDGHLGNRPIRSHPVPADQCSPVKSTLEKIVHTASRREFLCSAGVASCVSASLLARTRPASERPNVIIVLTDDQGYGDLSCHGNPVLKTPAMDRLFHESVRFTDFHSAPMCSPTRGQLLSGMDAAHNRATATEAGRCLLRRDIPTMADAFAAGGYRTGAFGKWHLGDSYPYRPMDRGFLQAKYHLGGALVSASEFENDYFDGIFHDEGVKRRFSGYCTDFWFDEAVKWMGRCGRNGEPFFCYLPTNAPHGPRWVAEKYSSPYQKPDLPAEYFGMIANIDENLAKLEIFLREAGLRDNTILIFMSDNGGTGGVKVFNAGMRAAKTSIYDGGHRVPCFVRWPAGKLRAPCNIDAPAQMQDIMPTLLELCGIGKPQNAKFDGQNLAGLLRGKPNSLPDRMLIVQYGRNLEKWDASVIWNQWRLIKGEELYDFHADPAEKNDLAGQRSDVVKKMRAHYEKWWAGIEPTVHEFCLLSIGSEKENPVTLSCSDWQECSCRNSSTLDTILEGQGGPRGGPWGVLVERDGNYEISLRRWPQDQNLPLSAAYPGKKVTVATLKAGKAFPIAGAKLRIAGQELAIRTNRADTAAVFRVKLRGGTKTLLHGWFLDAAGNDLCGAYYATVRQL